MIGNVLKILAKSVLIPLRLTTAALATDAAVHKKMFTSGRRCPSDLSLRNMTIIISNEEINIMKIIMSLQESGLLIKGVSKTIKNKAKEKNEDLSECYEAL